MANATQVKFGYPHSLIHEAAHWSVQLRPVQATLGALVLVCSEPVTAFGAVSAPAFAELHMLVPHIERVLSRLTAYSRINYLMLMMVDPDVHFHVLPRYEGSRDWQGIAFPDAGWPAPPVLGEGPDLEAPARAGLVAALRDLWAQEAP